MAQRRITEFEVEAVLADYHTHYHDVEGNDIMIGLPNGRRIKVVTARGTNPPHVITVAD
jgi:hypothetical protein